MFVSRRKILGFLSVMPFGSISVATADESNQLSSNNVLGHQLHDDVSISLLHSYARALALENADARWEAQMMFHEAQLARQGGGTMGHKLGYRLKGFIEAHENGRTSMAEKIELMEVT